MQIEGQSALVTGGASGLGEAAARALAAHGARVAIVDRDADKAHDVAAAIGGVGLGADVTDSAAFTAALDAAEQAHGTPRIVLHVAGIGGAQRLIAKDGSPAPLEVFERIVRVNLIGSYNVARLAAVRMAALAPLSSGERGVLVMTASVAAFDGQVGQEAYAASKGGVVSMTLPLARDLATHGIRVATIAPGLFDTPLMQTLPEPVQQALGASVPFPQRLGQPAEFAELALHMVRNAYLNGETVRLDGSLRMAPR
ncbi:MAG: SDR family NAD(P)-dependent oxidoreductase [Betaproteobacteria bacterium]|nr:SDR family NAD(P)-dependent oxidoreductase [Betaproteobacteria bacterium]